MCINKIVNEKNFLNYLVFITFFSLNLVNYSAEKGYNPEWPKEKEPKDDIITYVNLKKKFDKINPDKKGRLTKFIEKINSFNTKIERGQKYKLGRKSFFKNIIYDIMSPGGVQNDNVLLDFLFSGIYFMLKYCDFNNSESWIDIDTRKFDDLSYLVDFDVNTKYECDWKGIICNIINTSAKNAKIERIKQEVNSDIAAYGNTADFVKQYRSTDIENMNDWYNKAGETVDAIKIGNGETFSADVKSNLVGILRGKFDYEIDRFGTAQEEKLIDEYCKKIENLKKTCQDKDIKIGDITDRLFEYEVGINKKKEILLTVKDVKLEECINKYKNERTEENRIVIIDKFKGIKEQNDELRDRNLEGDIDSIEVEINEIREEKDKYSGKILILNKFKDDKYNISQDIENIILNGEESAEQIKNINDKLDNEIKRLEERDKKYKEIVKYYDVIVNNYSNELYPSDKKIMDLKTVPDKNCENIDNLSEKYKTEANNSNEILENSKAIKNYNTKLEEYNNLAQNNLIKMGNKNCEITNESKTEDVKKLCNNLDEEIKKLNDILKERTEKINKLNGYVEKIKTNFNNPLYIGEKDPKFMEIPEIKWENIENLLQEYSKVANDSDNIIKAKEQEKQKKIDEENKRKAEEEEKKKREEEDEKKKKEDNKKSIKNDKPLMYSSKFVIDSKISKDNISDTVTNTKIFNTKINKKIGPKTNLSFNPKINTGTKTRIPAPNIKVSPVMPKFNKKITPKIPEGDSKIGPIKETTKRSKTPETRKISSDTNKSKRSQSTGGCCQRGCCKPKTKK